MYRCEISGRIAFHPLLVWIGFLSDTLLGKRKEILKWDMKAMMQGIQTYCGYRTDK